MEFANWHFEYNTLLNVTMVKNANHRQILLTFPHEKTSIKEPSSIHVFCPHFGQFSI